MLRTSNKTDLYSLLAVLIMLPALLVGQSSRITNSFNRAKALHADLYFTQAEHYYRSAYSNVKSQMIVKPSEESIALYVEVGSHLSQFLLDYADFKESKRLGLGMLNFLQSHAGFAYENSRLLEIVGNSYGYLNQLDSSVYFLEKALLTFENNGQPATTKGILVSELASNLLEAGNYEKADSLLRLARDELISLGKQKTLSMAYLLRNLAISQLYAEDYTRGLEFALRAYTLSDSLLSDISLERPLFEATVGSAYWYGGRIAESLPYFQREIAIRKALKRKPNIVYATALHNLGATYENLDQFQKAINSYREAIRIAIDVDGDDTFFIAWPLDQMGRCYSMMGDPQKGAEHSARAVEIWGRDKKTYRRDFAFGCQNLASAYLMLDRPDKALEQYQRALSVITNNVEEHNYLSNPEPEGNRVSLTTVRILMRKSEMMYRLFQEAEIKDDIYLKGAHETALSGIRFADAIRAGEHSENAKLALSERAHDLYELAIATALDLYDITGDDSMQHLAYRMSESAKSMLLLGSMLASDSRRFARLPAEIRAEEQQFHKDLADWEQRLAVVDQAAELDLQKRSEVSAKLFDVRERYQLFLTQLKADFPDYFNIKYDLEPITVEDTQAFLKEAKNDLLLEYFVGKKELYLFSITSDSFNVLRREINDSLRSEIKAFREAITNGNKLDFIQYGHHLYQVLLEDIFQRTSPKKVLIIPDGHLHSLPFDALLFANSDSSAGYNELPYVLKNQEISYGYSATLARQILDRPVGSAMRAYAGFAPTFLPTFVNNSGNRTEGIDSGRGAPQTYLPFTQIEVKKVASLFEQNESWLNSLYSMIFDRRVVSFFEKDATESVVKKSDLADFQHLHFSTHGILNEDEPKLSGLVFSRGQSSREDGVLYQGEIYGLELNADLVALSACETGLGKWNRGEGVLGLGRAFLFAGAQNVLASLWRIDDMASADLMTYFFSQTLRGESYVSALRASKLRSITRGDDFARPDRWAAFILVGNN
ncbi:MAG: CHAT domain-containing tetratricopeptide repeat protein [Calditrichota bacterium]